MSIIKIRKQKNFSIISNIPLNDKSISFKAKGIWAYLMSKPEDWEVRVSNLINTSTEGRDAIYSGIKELVEAGYMNKIQHRDESGKMTGIEYQVFEDPVNRISKPLTENPEADNPDSDNRTQLKTDNKIKTDDDKTGPPPQENEESPSSSFSEIQLLSIIATLMAFVPEQHRKPAVKNTVKKALKFHSEDYIRAAIAYTVANSNGNTVQKFKAYLGKCIDNGWAEGWEPDQGNQIDKEATKERFRRMSDKDLKFLAGDGTGNLWAVEELKHRGLWPSD
jgi:hypothetical protein